MKIIADSKTTNQIKQSECRWTGVIKHCYFHYLTYTPKATGASAPSLQEEIFIPIHKHTQRF